MGIDVKECSDGKSSSQCEISVSDIRRVLKKDDASKSKGKFYLCYYYIQIILRINVFHHHFYLPEVHIQVQNCHGVLGRLLPCILAKHDLRPILSCRTCNSATQYLSAPATARNLLFWWLQLASATATLSNFILSSIKLVKNGFFGSKIALIAKRLQF